MSICGYHPRMGSAFEEFAEALTLAISDKATRSHTEFADQTTFEIDQIEILRGTLERYIALEQNSEVRTKLRGVLGIVYMAEFLMNLDERRHGSREEFEDYVSNRAKFLAEILEQFEDRFESFCAGTPILIRVKESIGILLRGGKHSAKRAIE